MDVETLKEHFNSSELPMDSEGHLETIPVKYGISFILSSILFFEIINKIITYTLPPKSEYDYENWVWKNMLISWIHAGILGIWVLSSFILYYKEFKQDLIDYHNMYIYALVAFTTGYFFYDFYDICRNTNPKNMWEVLVHHVSVSLIFFYNVMICRCLPFTCIALAVEINSFFLHSRKLLQKSHFKFDNLFYRCICWINLITFLAFRFGALIAIYIGIYYWHKRVTYFYIFFLCMSCFVMNVINLVLVWRLIKSDIIRFYSSKAKKAAKASSSPPPANNNVKHHVDLSHTNGFVKQSEELRQNGHAISSSSNKEKTS